MLPRRVRRTSLAGQRAHRSKVSTGSPGSRVTGPGIPIGLQESRPRSATAANHCQQARAQCWPDEPTSHLDAPLRGVA
jgi:hypothetical protein